MPSAVSSLSLQPEQLYALYNILTHHETYAEVQDFKYEDSVGNFGLPLTMTTGGGPTPYPVLQMLAEKLWDRSILSDSLWANITAMLQRLAAANLSDSYDKGFMGLRKSAATAWSASLESVIRGMLSGKPSTGAEKPVFRAYNHSKASDVEQAWEDAVQGMLYGDLLDRIFGSVAASPDMNDIPTEARAALELVIVQ
jgi:hypothetical protein